jgi:hypothetical protein
MEFNTAKININSRRRRGIIMEKVFLLVLESHSGDKWFDAFSKKPSIKKLKKHLEVYPDYEEGTLDWYWEELEVINP